MAQELKRAELHYKRAVENVAEKASQGVGESKIAADMGQTRDFVRYWSAKAADPTLQRGTIGGARNCKFSAEEQILVEEQLWAEVQREPMKGRRYYANVLTERGFPIDAQWVGRAFKRLNFSSKKAKYKTILKFTISNALYTCKYLVGIQGIDWFILKFFDESRFDERERIERGWSARGQPLAVVAEPETTRSWSVSCLTDLSHPHGFHLTTPVSGSNSGVDHLQAMLDFLTTGALSRGDVIIMDNSSIHNAAEVLPVLGMMFDAAGVRLYFLPVYSPEYNPCEQVFARAKRYLRDERGTLSFQAEILQGFGCVTYFDMIGFYEECIEKPIRA